MKNQYLIIVGFLLVSAGCQMYSTPSLEGPELEAPIITSDHYRLPSFTIQEGDKAKAQFIVPNPECNVDVMYTSLYNSDDELIKSEEWSSSFYSYSRWTIYLNTNSLAPGLYRYEAYSVSRAEESGSLLEFNVEIVDNPADSVTLVDIALDDSYFVNWLSLPGDLDASSNDYPKVVITVTNNSDTTIDLLEVPWAIEYEYIKYIEGLPVVVSDKMKVTIIISAIKSGETKSDFVRFYLPNPCVSVTPICNYDSSTFYIY